MRLLSEHQHILAQLPLLTLLALSSGCGGDDAVSATDLGGESESSGEAETETGTETETGEPEPAPEAPLARGITITEIEANQGVAVPLVQGGDWIDGGGRNTRLIAGRATLLRVHYLVEPAWVPREIAATLTLEHGDGTRVELEQIREVDGDSWAGDLDRTFTFELHPSLGATAPGVAFQVALRETGDETLGVAEGVPLSPSAGPALIGFEALELLPEIVLVPLLNPAIAEPTPIPYEELERRLFAWLPVAELAFEVHEPIALDAPVIQAPLGLISDLREQEAPAADVAYIGVVETEDGRINGAPTYTIGVIETPDPSEASRRVAVAAWGGDLDQLARSLAHATFVQHTAQRVACPGQGLGIEDPNYPYPDGKIGIWGFNIVTGQLYNPNLHHDIASYCAPRWVSDYSWNHAIASLQITSEW